MRPLSFITRGKNYKIDMISWEIRNAATASYLIFFKEKKRTKEREIEESLISFIIFLESKWCSEELEDRSISCEHQEGSYGD